MRNRRFLRRPIVVLAVGLAIATTLIVRQCHHADQARAFQQLAAWSIPGIPPTAHAKLEYNERAGETSTRVYVEARTSDGGLSQTLAALKCFSYGHPDTDGVSMYKYIGAHLSLPPMEEMNACGTCDFDGEIRIRYIRFKDRDVMEVEKITL